MYCTNAFYFWTQEPQSIQLWVLKYVNYSSFSKFKIFWHETDLFVSENLQNIIQFSRGRLVIFYTEMMKKVSKNFPILDITAEHQFLLIKYLPELKRRISRNRRLELKMTNPYLLWKVHFSSILATYIEQTFSIFIFFSIILSLPYFS